MTDHSEMTEHDVKVARSRHRAGVHKTLEKTLDHQAKWLQDMGVRFCAVWFYHPRTSWEQHDQVADTETFLECVDMAMSKSGYRYALWYDGEQWNLLCRKTGDTRRFKMRDAAEMVAIHNA